MTQDANPQTSDDTYRWIDLRPAGMKLYLAVHSGGNRLVIENGDLMPDAMRAMGYKPAGHGYWYSDELGLAPKLFTDNIPGARSERKYPRSEIHLPLLDKSKLSAAAAHLSAELDKSARTLLGWNKMGQPVFEDSDGVRHLINETKTVSEKAASTAVPGFYLRAVDDNMLAACAEGYIQTLKQSSPTSDCARPDTFMKAIGLNPQQDRPKFEKAVTSACVRELFKDRKSLLADRYELASQLSNRVASVGIGLSGILEVTILARRVMGLDKDLRGQSVLRVGGPDGFFDKLLPSTGVRIAETHQDASICAAFCRDAKEAAKILDERPLKSKTLLTFPVSSLKQAKALADALAENNHIEGAVHLGGDTGDSRLFVSLVTTDEKSAPFSFIEAKTYAEAWTWASTLANERTQAVESFKAGLATENDFTAASSFVFDNSYQTPYSSASKAGTPTSLIPRELAAATRTALDRIISNYGDVDEKVALECGFDRESIHEYLVPEQIDGVALMINAEERGRGSVCGDGTGVGKGRQIMAMVRRAVLKGQRCVVFSESPANLSDLMRDAKHLNSLDLLKPLLVNDAKLIDEDTTEEFETMPRSLLDNAIAAGEWPEGVNVIMLSYSQINKKAEDSAKVDWLLKIVDERVSVFGDEIHNAASLDSNVSENYSAIKQTSAGGVVNASATFAKEAKNIAFYREIFPPETDMNELQAMIAKGGEPFQEVVSDMLTSDGVLFRRETDLSEIEFSQIVDDVRLDENRETADKLSVIISEMTVLASDVAVVAAPGARNRRGGRRDGMGASLYHITRLFNAALLVPFVVEQAVQDLKDGMKPAFLLENTVGDLLKDAQSKDGTPPTFRDVLKRSLDQLIAGNDMDIEDALKLITPATRERYDFILTLISDFPPIEASVIDSLKHGIRQAGYTIGEITGRSLHVDEDGKVAARGNRDKTVVKNAFNAGEFDALVMNATGSTGMDLHSGQRFKDRRRRVLYEVQAPKNVLKQIQAYGRYSRRGQESAPKIVFPSSGLPFESRLAAMRNQKLRRLSANIQSNRNSTYLMGNIPDLLNSVGDAVVTKYAEMRPDLLRRLGLQERYETRHKLSDVIEQDNYSRGEPDVQPEKATEVAVIDDARRERAARDVEQDEDQSRSANEFLSRLSLLPCREQERILSELTAEYEMNIAELDSLGVNPLRPREFDGVVHARVSKLFEGSLDSGANSSFDAPMYLMEASVERQVVPMSSEVVVEELEKLSAKYDFVLDAVSNVVRNRDQYLSHYLKDEHLSVDDAIAHGNRKIQSMVKDIEHLKMAVEAFAPGRQITFVDADGVSRQAIIVGIQTPWEGSEHLMASYRVKIAIPGSENLKEYGIETVLRNPGVSSFDKDGNLIITSKDGLQGNDYEKILASFDKADRHRIDSAKFLVGNVYRAVRYATQFRLGSLVSFVDDKGFRHRGVLINKQAERRLSQIAVRIDGVDAAMSALEQGVEINSSPTGSGRNLVITPLGGDKFHVRIPEPYKRRNVKQWPSEQYRRLFESMVADDFDIEEAKRNNMSKAAIAKAETPKALVEGLDSVREVLDIVSDAGFRSYFVAAKHKDKVGYDDKNSASWDIEKARSLA